MPGESKEYRNWVISCFDDNIAAQDKVQKPRSNEQGFCWNNFSISYNLLEFEGNTRHKVGWLLWRTVVIPIPLVGQVIALQ